MNLKTSLSEKECERFRRECNFSDEERAIFDLTVKNKTALQVEMALKHTPMAMSEATVKRRLKNIRHKIDKVNLGL